MDLKTISTDALFTLLSQAFGALNYRKAFIYASEISRPERAGTCPDALSTNIDAFLEAGWTKEQLQPLLDRIEQYNAYIA